MESSHKKWKVTVRLYSGRQNPEWVLTEKQADYLQKQWDQAIFVNTVLLPPSPLGYTGCRVQKYDHTFWVLYNGIISLHEKEKEYFKKDPNKTLELFLLHTGPEEVKALLHKINIF